MADGSTNKCQNKLHVVESLYGGVKKILNYLYVGILFSYTMVNTLAALVCGGHIVELKGSIPCSNNIVLSEVDNSKEKKTTYWVYK